MAHNTILAAPTTTGDTICDFDLAAGTPYPTTGKVQATVIYVSSTSSTTPSPLTTSNPIPVAGTVTANAGTNLNTSTLALESGGNLAAINGKLPALGQALAAASVPVVLTAAQLASLAPYSSVGITGSVAVTGTFYQATQPVSLASLPALPSGTNAIGSITNTSFASTQSGTWNVGLSAGTNTIGNAGTVATTSGGWTPNLVNSAASTNATLLKSSAGQIGLINLFNNGSTVAYLKLYNSATTPTAGSGTPVAVIGIPAGGGNVAAIPAGLAFSSGIGYTITGGATNSDTTAVAANQILGTIATL